MLTVFQSIKDEYAMDILILYVNIRTFVYIEYGKM